MHRKAEEEDIAALWPTTRTPRGAAWSSQTVGSHFADGPLDVDVRAKIGERRGPDARDLQQIVDAGERTVVRAPLQDRLRGDRPDVRQRVELFCSGGVQVDRADRDGAGAGLSTEGRFPA